MTSRKILKFQILVSKLTTRVRVIQECITFYQYPDTIRIFLKISIFLCLRGNTTNHSNLYEHIAILQVISLLTIARV